MYVDVCMCAHRSVCVFLYCLFLFVFSFFGQIMTNYLKQFLYICVLVYILLFVFFTFFTILVSIGGGRGAVEGWLTSDWKTYLAFGGRLAPAFGSRAAISMQMYV